MEEYPKACTGKESSAPAKDKGQALVFEKCPEAPPPFKGFVIKNG